MKSEKSYFKKFVFDLPVSKGLSISSSLSSSKDIVSNIDYMERVAQMLVGSQVNSKTL